jgi:hypothetical protein
MSKKMPEAAKLYFQNWDVLETARNEVFSVFDDFWPTTWPIIQDRSEAAGLDIPRVWENKASSGNWVLGGRGKAQRSKNKPIKKSTSAAVDPIRPNSKRNIPTRFPRSKEWPRNTLSNSTGEILNEFGHLKSLLIPRILRRPGARPLTSPLNC